MTKLAGDLANHTERHSGEAVMRVYEADARWMLATVPLALGLFLASEARAEGWGGFYIDGAIGARNSTVDVRDNSITSISYSYPDLYSYSSTSTETSKFDVGKTNLLGQVSAGWRWDSDSIILGIGGFYDLAGDDAGRTEETAAYTWTSPPYSYSDSLTTRAELKQKNRYGLSLDIGPRWRTHPYLKLSYSWSEYEVRKSTSECSADSLGPTAFSVSNTHSGLGIGGGVRHLYNENLYFFAEVMWQDYSSDSNTTIPLCGDRRTSWYPPGYSYSATEKIKVEPTNLTGVIGIGWKL